MSPEAPSVPDAILGIGESLAKAIPQMESPTLRPTRAELDERFLDHVFRYHSPKPDQIPRYQAIRAAGRELARVIFEHTQPCADQMAAIRKVREAVMTANAAIALDGKTS